MKTYKICADCIFRADDKPCYRRNSMLIGEAANAVWPEDSNGEICSEHYAAEVKE